MASQTFTNQAIVYLKSSLLDDTGRAVSLPKKDQPVVRKFTDDFHTCYLVDQGGNYEYIQQSQMEQEKLSLEDLHVIGLRNLQKLAVENGGSVKQHGHVFAFLMGGNFEASVILLDDFWNTHFRQFVPGEYAIAIPTRDVLAFCDIESELGRIELKQIIDRVWPSQDHPLSDKVFNRKRNGELVKLTR